MGRLKRFFSILLVMAMACSTIALQGCNSNKDKKVELEVYYCKNESNFADVIKFYDTLNQDITINTVVFDTPQEMNDKLAADYAAGDGPDVILLTSQADMDIYKSIKAENLADLTSYFEKDESYNSDNYFTSIIEGTRVNGKQYIVPFYFSYDMYGVRKSIETSTGVDMSQGVSDYSSFIKTLQKQQEAILASDSDKDPVIGFDLTAYANPERNIYRSLGLNMIDKDGKIVVSEQDFKAAMSIVKEFYDCYGTDLSNIYQRQITGYMNSDSYLFTGNNAFLATLLTSIVEGQEDQLSYYTIPAADATNPDKEYTAYIHSFGVVNSSCKNKEGAYKFLKALMDYNDTKRENSFAIPVVKKVYSQIYTYIKSGYFTYSLASTNKIMVRKWTDEEDQKYENIINNTTSSYIVNNQVLSIIQESMKDYFAGTKSLDECYTKMMNKLQLYIRE
jgi:ABC-type glycerol-3-phosphate transport system substrate-binding protein